MQLLIYLLRESWWILKGSWSQVVYLASGPDGKARNSAPQLWQLWAWQGGTTWELGALLPDSEDRLEEAHQQPHSSQPGPTHSCSHRAALIPSRHARGHIPHLLQKHRKQQVILDDGLLIYKQCISLGVEQKGNHLMAPLFSSMNTF